MFFIRLVAILAFIATIAIAFWGNHNQLPNRHKSTSWTWKEEEAPEITKPDYRKDKKVEYVPVTNTVAVTNTVSGVTNTTSSAVSNTVSNTVSGLTNITATNTIGAVNNPVGSVSNTVGNTVGAVSNTVSGAAVNAVGATKTAATAAVATKAADAKDALLTAAASPTIGGAFTLTDQNGNIVKDTDLQGKLVLVFFGFTRCPDECPLAVGNMNAALKALGKSVDKVVPVFITVDPTYDTSAVLKKYLSALDPHWAALTGTQAQIDAAEKAYKIFAEAQPAKPGEAARVNHSGYIYLMGRDGKFIQHFPNTASPKELADAITKKL